MAVTAVWMALYVVGTTSPEVLCTRKFRCGATSLKYVPKVLNNDMDTDGKHVIVGFEDGVVRVLCIGSDPDQPGKVTLRSRCVIKPHSAEIIDIALDSTGATVATASKDGTVFLLKTTKLPEQKTEGYSWAPIRFFGTVPGATSGARHL